MAPKTLSLSHQPSKEKQEREEPSSDEEEEDDNKEEESEDNSSDETEDGSSEDEEEDQENARNNKLPIPVPKIDSKPISQENGSDSDPDSEGSPSDYKLQPIRKPSSSSVSKRSRLEGGESQDSPRSGKKSKTEEKKSSSTPGAGCITRLWSNEDEIAVLNGMIDFMKVKGLDFNSEAFYNFVKGKLQVDFSRDQLRTKISRMKKRFVNALKKGENGSDPVFSKPHEDMAFELSKKIWGDTINNRVKNETVKKDIVKVEKVAVDEKAIVLKEKDGEEGEFWSKYPFFSESFHNMEGNFPSVVVMSFLKEKLSLIGDVKAKEFDEKWKQLIVEKIELNHKMLTLMTEQVKMALINNR